MSVIAMTREMGSRGKDVALGLSDRLGLRIIHHEIVERRIANRLDVKESAVHRYLEGDASMLERWRIDKEALALYTAEEICELAQQDDVLIRGWGATQLLRPITHVVCVRVCAPLALRVGRLMERLDLDDPSAALKEIKANDAAHARTMRQLFQVHWEDPLLYDVVLNTERVSIPECVEQIEIMVSQPSFQETNESQAKLAELKRAPSTHVLRSREATTPAVDFPSASDHERHIRRHLNAQHDDVPTAREERDLLL